MTVPTCVLLALPPAGDAPPPHLADAGEWPVTARLARQLTRHGPVVVLAWTSLAPELAPRLPDATELVTVDDRAEALAWLAHGSGDLVVLEGDVVTGELALDRLLAATAGSTAALVGGTADGTTERATDGAAGRADGSVGDRAAGRATDGADEVPAHAAYGRVVAVGSACDPAAGAAHVSRGAVAVAEADRPALASLGAGPDAGRHLHALLVAALLHDARPVLAASLPRGLPWRRPADRPAAQAAADEVAATDEDRVLLDAAVKAEDGWFTTFLVSPYSKHWARWCARRGLRPNQVTVASMAIGVLAAGAFALGHRGAAVAGAVLLQLAFTLDCVDGQLARYTGRFSSAGAWLDSIFDRAKEYAVLAGLVVGGLRAGDEASLWVLAGAALTLQVARHTLDFGYAAQQRADLAQPALAPLRALEDPDAWAPTAAADETGPTPQHPARRPTDAGDERALPHRAVAGLRRAEEVPALKWAKRVVVLPIGERFALISLLAVVATPRVTLWALLGWGGVAMAYTFGGRLLRTLA